MAPVDTQAAPAAAASRVPVAVPPPSRGRQATPGRARSRRARRDTLAAVGFLVPGLALLVLLRLLPTIGAALESLKRGLPGSTLPARWVGLDNFSDLLQSPPFWNSVRQTLLFNLLINPIQIAAALAIAVLISRRVPAAGLWRTLIFIPSAIPLLGSSVLWGIALRPDGVVNGVLGAVGIAGQPFLTSPGQVLWSIILLASWIGIGYWMIFLIAGLQDIPGEYLEAASLDGAGPLRSFWHVTLPLLKRPLLFVLVADTVTNFVLFAPIQVLTRGGPEGASNLLMYDVYHNAFQLSDPHTAAAELVLLLVLMLAIVSAQFRLLRTSEDR